jgi:plastocyanin
VTEFSVGPGVQQAMADNGDEPRSDEQFIILREGHKVSMTFSTGGVYYYYEEDNRTQRCPF